MPIVNCQYYNSDLFQYFICFGAISSVIHYNPQRNWFLINCSHSRGLFRVQVDFVHSHGLDNLNFNWPFSLWTSLCPFHGLLWYPFNWTISEEGDYLHHIWEDEDIGPASQGRVYTWNPQRTITRNWTELIFLSLKRSLKLLFFLL